MNKAKRGKRRIYVFIAVLLMVACCLFYGYSRLHLAAAAPVVTEEELVSEIESLRADLAEALVYYYKGEEDIGKAAALDAELRQMLSRRDSWVK